MLGRHVARKHVIDNDVVRPAWFHQEAAPIPVIGRIAELHPEETIGAPNHGRVNIDRIDVEPLEGTGYNAATVLGNADTRLKPEPIVTALYRLVFPA